MVIGHTRATSISISVRFQLKSINFESEYLTSDTGSDDNNVHLLCHKQSVSLVYIKCAFFNDYLFYGH